MESWVKMEKVVREGRMRPDGATMYSPLAEEMAAAVDY
jgi:hypothetical protein